MSKQIQQTCLIMGGGTGGHIYPAIAVAEELKKRDWAVEWMGSKYGMEATLVADKGYPLHLLDTKGVRGNGLLSLIKVPIQILLAVLVAMGILRKINPKFVVGFGGYSTVPGAIACWLLRVPLIIHEQNAVAGTANKILVKVAKFSLAGYPNVLPKTIYCGNPLRADFAKISPQPKELRQPLRLLVMGGSNGAQKINQLLPSALDILVVPIDVIHQSGEKNYEETLAHYKHINKRQSSKVKVVAYIKDVIKAYQWADIIICRSGAMTIAEIMYMQLPSILIPFPYAIDNHQQKNAEWLVNLGGAELLIEHHLSEENIAQKINQFIENPSMLTNMRKTLSGLQKNNATRVITDVCLEAISA